MLTNVTDRYRDSVNYFFFIEPTPLEALRLKFPRKEYESVIMQGKFPDEHNWIYIKRIEPIEEFTGRTNISFKEAKRLQMFLFDRELNKDDFETFAIATEPTKGVTDEDIEQSIEYTRNMFEAIVFTPHKHWYHNKSSVDLDQSLYMMDPKYFAKCKRNLINLLLKAKEIYEGDIAKVREVYDRWIEEGEYNSMLEIDHKKLLYPPKLSKKVMISQFDMETKRRERNPLMDELIKGFE